MTEYKLLSRVPTQEMIDAADNTPSGAGSWRYQMQLEYQAMYDAAPEVELSGEAKRALDDIIKVAASLARADDIPSHYKEDWKIRVPAGVLRELLDCHDAMRRNCIKLKNAHETIRAALMQMQGVKS